MPAGFVLRQDLGDIVMNGDQPLGKWGGFLESANSGIHDVSRLAGHAQHRVAGNAETGVNAAHHRVHTVLALLWVGMS